MYKCIRNDISAYLALLRHNAQFFLLIVLDLSETRSVGSTADKASGEIKNRVSVHLLTYVYLIVVEGSCREAILPIAHPLTMRGPMMGKGERKGKEGKGDNSTVGTRGPVPGRYFGNRRPIINRKSRKPLTSETVRRLYAGYVAANHTLPRSRTPNRLALPRKSCDA